VAAKVSPSPSYLAAEDYRDYIKNFEWNSKKYMYSKPLLELCGEITKVWIALVLNFRLCADLKRCLRKRQKSTTR